MNEIRLFRDVGLTQEISSYLACHVTEATLALKDIINSNKDFDLPQNYVALKNAVERVRREIEDGIV